ncbi:MAG: CDP-alcohol phosphatidyltransferase family protein [Thermoflavifilum sp.]|nr:CDP-alcohol phosphatidyltransferase family protein [Thermoflavifilum sp.]
MKQLPNLLTLGNLLCGTLSLVFILQSPCYISSYNGQDYLITAPEPLFWGSVLIGIAAILDFADGFIARLLKANSEMGKQLDALADLVTFGVAPAMILFQLLKNAYMQLPDAINVSLINLSFTLLLPCFGALRLARYNVFHHQARHFTGLPIPAAGLLIASFPLILLKDRFHFSAYLQNIWILYAVLIMLCYLMVSRWPMFSLKFNDFRWRHNWYRYVWIVLFIGSIFWLHSVAIPFGFVLYILLSLLAKKQLLSDEIHRTH